MSTKLIRCLVCGEQYGIETSSANDAKEFYCTDAHEKIGRRIVCMEEHRAKKNPRVIRPMENQEQD